MKAKYIVLPVLVVCFVFAACAGTKQLRYAELGVVVTHDSFTAVQRIAANAYLDGELTEEKWLDFVSLSDKVQKAHEAYRRSIMLAQKVEQKADLSDYLKILSKNQKELSAAVKAAVDFLVEVGVLDKEIEL